MKCPYLKVIIKDDDRISKTITTEEFRECMYGECPFYCQRKVFDSSNNGSKWVDKCSRVEKEVRLNI